MALEVTGRFRYPKPKAEWLARHTEEIIDPDRTIVDAHHHLWDEPGNVYFTDDLLADLRTGHRIVATVAVQAHYGYRPTGPEHLKPVGETETLEMHRCEVWDRVPGLRPCAAIIGFANLSDSDRIDEVLDAHSAASPAHFRGVRQSVARDSHFPEGVVLRPAQAGMLADPSFRQGVRRLGSRGLVFDAMLYHQQIPELTELAGEVTATPIVLDHYGCPLGVGYYRGREQERFETWRRDITALARRPNVCVKIGGLGMIVTGAEYHLAATPPTSAQLAADWRPWFDVCVTAFGTRRCMFESNFPVDKAMYSYAVGWNALKRLAAGCSATEQDDLFAGTASRVYHLDSA